MGHVADTAFAAGPLHAPDAWFGLVGYAFQIYFDFSGYSDMACGLALMMGFVLIQNFDSPYQADSITDFWRRWHISLSTWLRDYLYIPLGGNRLGERRTYVNLMTVMLLGGLWHGASWNFVLWGAIHGGMLAFERAQGEGSPYRRLPRAAPDRRSPSSSSACPGCSSARRRSGRRSRCSSRCSASRAVTAASDAPAGSMYTRFHVAVFVLAALLVWRGAQHLDLHVRGCPLPRARRRARRCSRCRS